MGTILFMAFVYSAGRTFSLDYQKPLRITIRSPRALLEDKVVIADDQSLLFFNLNGQFLGKVGRFGQGPGELQGINGFVVSESGQVGILDLAAKTLSLFQWPGGAFIRSFPEQAQAIFADYPSEKFYLLRLDPQRLNAHLNSNAGLSDYELPVLEEIELDKAERVHPDRRFHLPSEPITRRHFNDRGHWIRTKGGKMYVLDEFALKIAIYHPETFERQAVQPLRLPGYVEPPAETPNLAKMTNDEYRDWWYSFSRFLDLNAGENRISVVYLSPNPGETSLYKCMVVSLDNNWEIRSRDSELGHYQTERYYLGSNSKHYGFIGDVSDGLFPKYLITLREW